MQDLLVSADGGSTGSLIPLSLEASWNKTVPFLHVHVKIEVILKFPPLYKDNISPLKSKVHNHYLYICVYLYYRLCTKIENSRP